MAGSKPYVIPHGQGDFSVRIGTLLQWYEEQQMPEGWFEDVKGRLDTARSFVDRYHEEATHISASDMLSEKGRAIELAQLRESVQPHIGKVRQQARELRAKAEAERAAANSGTPKTGIDAVLEQLQLQERRAVLRELDPVELVMAYRVAAQNGDDPQLERAIETAPPKYFARRIQTDPNGPPDLVDPVSKQLLAEAAELRVVRLRPITGDLESLASMYESVAQGMAREIGMGPDTTALDEMAKTGGQPT